ncbi:MAG: gamma-glutamyl-gamma-aminobutyrate hydrolase family protein [Alkalispirochaeta sp.]
MRIDVMQHVPFEGPGEIAPLLEAQGHTIVVTRLYAGDRVPPIADVEALVVMGGPMSVHDVDQYPWLAGETSLIRRVIDSRRPVLGVCLGAQLIASAVGARVYRGHQKEIGWFPVTMTPAAATSRLMADWPAEAQVLHWHGDTFDLPSGARLVASSPAYQHQAFELEGHVAGLQFHLEMTEGNVRDIVENCRDELVPGPYVQSAERILRDSAEPEPRQLMLTSLLRRWIESGTPGGGYDG